MKFETLTGFYLMADTDRRSDGYSNYSALLLYMYNFLKTTCEPLKSILQLIILTNVASQPFTTTNLTS